MRLEKIILDDFLTYSHLEYEIQTRPLLVQGLNLTDEGQKSNGSGKSGILTGIEFCITASNSRDVRDIELISFGQKEARAQLVASCDVRKESIHIDWTIKAKGSNKLTLTKKSYEGDWEEVSFSNVNDGKKYIVAWFAISKEDLFNYYIINKTRFKSFFKASNKEKVDLINRFSDASIIADLEKIDNSELEEKFSNLETEISKIDGKIELIEQQIEAEQSRDLKEELEEEKNDILEEIESIKESIKESKRDIQILESKKKELIKDSISEGKKIKEYSTSKIPIQKSLDIEKEALIPIEKELTEAQILVEEFKVTDWDKKRVVYEDKIETQNDKESKENEGKDKLDVQETKILKFLQGIGVRLEGAITCPSCFTEFILEGDISTLKEKKISGEKLLSAVAASQDSKRASIKSIKEIIKEIEESIKSINKKEQTENESKNKLTEVVFSIKKKIEIVDTKITDLDNTITSLDKSIDRCREEISAISLRDKGFDIKVKSAESDIKGFEAEIESYKREISNLKQGDSKAAIRELKSELKKLEKSKETEEVKREKLGDKIYERNQWATNFKQFRMFLANQSLEVIEFHCNRYLHDMSSDLRVKIEGYKVLADGSTKDEITAKVIRSEERSFSSFSGGEQGRLLFASILANRHLINDSHPYGGLDFLSVDEVFEGVDGVGLKSLIQSAKQLQVACMIVTHVTDEDTSEDILTVVKENGISTIKN